MWLSLIDSHDFASICIIYSILFFLLVIDLINKPLKCFFTPSSIVLLFTTLNFSLGNFAFHNDFFLKGHVSTFEKIYQFNFLIEANQYFIITLLLVYLLKRKNKVSNLHLKKLKLGRKILVIPYFLILFMFLFIRSESNILGILKIGTVISLILNISRLTNWKFRSFLYLSAICLFAIISYDDKRNILLSILAVILVEVNYSRLFKISDLSKIIFGSLGILSILLVLTIFRGFAGFELARNWKELPEYIGLFFASSNYFFSWIFHISETYTTYFHSIQAIEHTLKTSNYLYGSTIIKALFVPIPSIIIEKPWSIIDHYTNNLYPAFRRMNGALSPNALGEFFFNFGWIGALLFPLLIRLFDSIYIGLFKDRVKSSLSFWSIIFILIYFRGSGLDLYLAYVLTCQLFIVIDLIFKKKFIYVRSSHH